MGGCIFAGGLHLHHEHPGQPRCELSGARPLGTVRPTGSHRDAKGGGRALGHRDFPSDGRVVESLSDFSRPGLQPLAVVGGGNRRALHPPLVLVAHIGSDGNRGHGPLAGGRHLFHMGARRTGCGTGSLGSCASVLAEIGVGRLHHHPGLGGQRLHFPGGE